jgi:hypothetical protein
MSTINTPVVEYACGDIIHVEGYSPITITKVIVSGRQIGYTGIYTVQPNNIQMELSWIPHGLIKGLI